MLKLIIEDDEGRKTVVPFVRDEITIGRQEGNTIRLTERNVSRRHARLLRQNGHVVVEDLGSYNGIRINGEKIAGRADVADGDLIQIGDYDLAVQREGADQPSPHAPPPPPEAVRSNGVPPPPHLEPVTEAMSQAFEEAEPISEEEETGEEDTARSARPAPPAPSAAAAEAARRQSTAVIRVDQVEATRKRELKDLDPEEAPRLVVLNTELAGREFACIRTELRIGRTDDNDIALDHRSLSRTHAKVVREDDGEWRIIDMQSANGLSVNGEPYAQVSLAHLDTIELGHLKLKFVAAGKAYTFVPGQEDRPRGKGGGSKAPLLIGLGALVVAAAAVGAYLATRGEDPAPQPVPETAELQPVAKPPEPAVAVTPKPPQPPKPDPAIAATAEAKQKIEAARAAMAARDFDRAVGLLEEARAVPNLPAGVATDVDDLRDQARAEQMLRQRLTDAQQALARGELDAAGELLDQAAATAAFQEQHKELSAALAKKVAERDRKLQLAAAKATREPKEPREATRPPRPSAADEARKLFEEGLVLFNKKQHKEAKTVFTRCLEADPSFAKCHLMLGSTYARLRELDQGAKHYEMFLRLAPNAPEAPKVKFMLEQYQTSRKGGSN